MFQVNWPFDLEKKLKIDFQYGSHLGFLIRTSLAIFDLQVPPTVSTKFRVCWHFISGKEAQNRFSRWRPSWISERTILAILTYKLSGYFLPSVEPTGLSVHEKNCKIDSKMAALESILGLPIRTISSSRPDTSYQVSSQSAFRFRRRCIK